MVYINVKLIHYLNHSVMKVLIDVTIYSHDL